MSRGYPQVEDITGKTGMRYNVLVCDEMLCFVRPGISFELLHYSAPTLTQSANYSNEVSSHKSATVPVSILFLIITDDITSSIFWFINSFSYS